MQLPQDFVNKMKKLLDTTADDFFCHLDKPSQKGITVNFDRLSASDFEKVCDFEHSPIEHINNGYYVDNLKFASHILNHLGVIYSQEPSAMYPVEMLGIEEGDLVLDICAAPGGKSTQILEKLNHTGLLIANEIVYNRSKILYENLSRMGYCNFAITCNSPEDYQKTNLQFNKILIDAPCGGEGMMRKKDFDLNAYNPQAIDTNAKRQLNILESVKDLLVDGGRLVYSTCTYDIRENEGVIAEFLKNNSNFRIVPHTEFRDVCSEGIKVDNCETNYSYRRYPHLHRGEGQYMICLEKTGICNYSLTEKFRAKNWSELHKKEILDIDNFFGNNTDLKNLKYAKRNDSVYLIPQSTVDFDDLNLVHIGIHLGSIVKNIFKPCHNIFHSLGKYFHNKIELQDDNIQKYLHGEELDIDQPDGYYVVTIFNTPLSGGKLKNGKLKNIYPKELRI